MTISTRIQRFAILFIFPLLFWTVAVPFMVKHANDKVVSIQFFPK